MLTIQSNVKLLFHEEIETINQLYWTEIKHLALKTGRPGFES